MKSKNLAKTLKLHGYQIGEVKEPHKKGSGFVDIKVTDGFALWITVGFDFFAVSYVCKSGQEDLPAIVSNKLQSINYLLEDIKEGIQHIEAEEEIA